MELNHRKESQCKGTEIQIEDVLATMLASEEAIKKHRVDLNLN